MKRDLSVISGSITNEQHTFLIDDMCMIVDMDMGCILKYGDKNTSDICAYYQKMEKSLEESGNKEMVDDIKLVSFDRWGVLTIEEICTIVNYGLAAHGNSFIELLSMSEAALHDRVRKLQEYGY